MKIYFRADASTTIGSGHIMRCLVLAERLRKYCLEITFICRALEGNLNEYIRNQGFKLLVPDPQVKQEQCEALAYQDKQAWLESDTVAMGLTVDAQQLLTQLGEVSRDDWLIVDHYGLDYRWQKHLRAKFSRIMVIDDLADRAHDCDLLLDQNYYTHAADRYRELVPAHCRLLLGPEYALLRDEFFSQDLDASRNRPKSGKTIFISFGGSDPGNETMKAIQAIKCLKHSNITLDVVVGRANPKIERLRAECDSLNGCRFHVGVNNIAELMAQADFAVAAGGISIWERLKMRLPTIAIAIAENQIQTLVDLDEEKYIRYLGYSSEVSVEMLAAEIDSFIANSEVCKTHETVGQYSLYWPQSEIVSVN